MDLDRYRCDVFNLQIQTDAKHRIMQTPKLCILRKMGIVSLCMFAALDFLEEMEKMGKMDIAG